PVSARGDAAALAAPDNAPLWHEPPEATDVRQPTPACPATLNAYAASVPLVLAMAWVAPPTTLNANAVAPAMAADRSMVPRLPPLRPLTMAALAAAATNAAAPVKLRTAATAICTTARTMGFANTDLMALPTLWKKLDSHE